MPISERERSFLARIAADPFDDDLRLVYADWLEEQGDPRGELVRLQQEHERVNRAWLGRYAEPHATDLAERIDQLTRLHWRQWYGAPPPQLRVSLKGGLLMVSVRVID